MIRHWGTALTAVSALSCASDPVRVEQAPTTLAASPAEVFADRGSIAVATVLDEGVAREVALGAEVSVTMSVYGATVSRSSQPSAARALPLGVRVTLDVHTAVTQIDSTGHALGRIENPFVGTAGRARFTTGHSYLTVLSDDVTDAAAWRVQEAYSLNAAGDSLAEPALGFAAGTPVVTLFGALSPP